MNDSAVVDMLSGSDDLWVWSTGGALEVLALIKKLLFESHGEPNICVARSGTPGGVRNAMWQYCTERKRLWNPPAQFFAIAEPEVLLVCAGKQCRKSVAVDVLDEVVGGSLCVPRHHTEVVLEARPRVIVVAQGPPSAVMGVGWTVLHDSCGGVAVGGAVWSCSCQRRMARLLELRKAKRTNKELK